MKILDAGLSTDTNKRQQTVVIRPPIVPCQSFEFRLTRTHTLDFWPQLAPDSCPGEPLFRGLPSPMLLGAT